jgi:titin
MPDIVSMQKGCATLRWTRPQSDGGSQITTFRVERRTVGAYLWEPVNPTERITETTYTVTGLQPDTDYEFRILAENKAGVSQPSMASRTAKYSK